MSSVDEMEFEPTSGKGEIVTRADLSRWTGQSQTTVDHWINEGMPVMQRATKRQPYKINTAAFFDWYRDRLRGGEDTSAARLEGIRITNALKQIELAERQGVLIPTDLAVALMTTVCCGVRDGILAVASQIHRLTPEQAESLDSALNDVLESTSATVSEKIRELETVESGAEVEEQE